MKHVMIETMFVLGLILTAGCGSEVSTRDISGTVTFAGQPIKYGQIVFLPKSKERLAPTGQAVITDGRYDTSLGGSRGIMPGPHQVRITAFSNEPLPESEDETLPSLSEPPLFVGYTIEADLKPGENDFDVPESAKGSGLSSKPSARGANEP